MAYKKDNKDANGNRKFNKEAYDLYDEKAKLKTIELFTKLKFEVNINPDPFAVDLMVYKNGEHVGYIECETRQNFFRLMKEYDTIHIPARKDKFFNLDKPTNYICWSSEFDFYYYIKGSMIKQCEILNTRLKGYNGTDNFFVIPKEKVTFYEYK